MAKPVDRPLPIEIKLEVTGLEDVNLNTVVFMEDVVRHSDDEEAYAEEGPVTLGEAIIRKAAKQLLEELAQSDEYPYLRKRVMNARAEAIHAAVKPLIEAAMRQPLQRTNIYGEPTGQSTTLTELIVDTAKAELRRPSDSRGSSYGATPTLVQKIVQEEVSRAFKKELTEIVEAEKKKLLALVRAQGAAIMGQALEQAAAVIPTVAVTSEPKA